MFLYYFWESEIVARSPYSVRLLHGQESPHAVRRVDQVVLGGHRERREVLQEVGGGLAAWK